MIKDDNTLKGLITALSKYDEDTVEREYEQLIKEGYPNTNVEDLVKVINSRLSGAIQREKEDYDYLQYSLREVALNSHYTKVEAHQVYGYIFPEDTLQVCDELDEATGKGNCIRLDVVDRWYIDDQGKKHHIQEGIQTVITEELRELYVLPKKVNAKNLLLSNINLNTYFGSRRLEKYLDKIFGLIVEVDDVTTPTQINNFIDKINSGVVPSPNYLINSGHGFHLYYVLDRPINYHEKSYDIYPVINNILNGIKDLVWTIDVSDTKPERMDISKGFTIIGNHNRKNKSLVVTAYKVKEEKCSLVYLRSFIDRPSDDKEYDITFPKRSRYTKEEVIKLYPYWAVKKFPESFDEELRQRLLNELTELERTRSTYSTNRQMSVCKTSLYSWFYRLISNPNNISHGNRYKCMVALAIFGVKCNINKEQVKADLIGLLSMLNSIEKKYKDDNFNLTAIDVNRALYVYKHPEKTCLYTWDWIKNFTGIDYESKTKRRPKGQRLPQSEHLKLARENRDKKYPNGSWRANSDCETRKQIIAFIKENPNANIKDCISRGICSQASVYKYWDSCRKELGLNINKSMTAEEKIKQYRKEKPTATKAQCIRELGLSKPTVYKHW